MKSYLIAFGALIVTLGMTFSGTINDYLNPNLAKHSRLKHYTDHAIDKFKDSNDKDLGPIDFLKSDKTHGRLGLDPWGSPYQYFIKYDDSKRLTITLWSKGKDSKTLLKPIDIMNGEYSGKKGDDFIYTKVM